jgi:dynein heavy chain
MARTLGIYCVVTNCTPQQCYDDAAGIFKGLSIAGIWGCFDEFNRIKLEVLSVIATQVQFIKAAKIAQVTTMIFPDRNMSEIKFNPTVGYFITMNPGYAGRQELPENLKVQFRGVCMMVPDRREIMKTFLATSGYTTMDDLATKFNIVYKQCEEQLSKQRHYDFGLRNIKSVLRQAGNILRERLETIREKEGKNPEGEVLLKIEEELMYKALKDMNLSKLVKDDVLLFTSLLDDVFVNQYKKNVPDKEVREHSEE